MVLTKQNPSLSRLSCGWKFISVETLLSPGPYNPQKYQTTLEQYLGNNHPGGCKKKPSLKVPRTNDSQTPAVVLLFGSQHFPNLKVTYIYSQVHCFGLTTSSSLLFFFQIADPYIKFARKKKKACLIDYVVFFVFNQFLAQYQLI